MERINQVLPQVKEPEMYATCAAVRITHRVDRAVCELDLANAGHPPILCFSAIDRKVFPFPSNAPPLGLMPESEFFSHTIEAGAGDLLLIATDGVTEVCDAAGQEFGIDRLEALLIERNYKPLEVIAAEILEAAARWGKQIDDQTLLLVRFSSWS
jgi:serine phosphatase RsbU (regulator of sigma subunit)